ncbi:MAG: ATP-binding cassette domain-containing protein [Luminiphilus sp.]|nr:ATP-binding cassette domain-containing protein [Luminiphilus sp.]
MVAVLAALCGTGVLYILNTEAKEIEQQGYNLTYAAAFVVLLIGYRVAQLTLIRRTSSEIEGALNQKRHRAVELALSLSIRDLEKIEKQSIRDGLNAHYGAISQALVPLISGVEASILLLFMFVYLMTLSPIASLITVVVMTFTTIGYVNHARKMSDALRSSADWEATFRRQADGITGGAKELQLGVTKRVALQQAMCDSSQNLAESRSNAAWFFADLIATGTSISYFLAGIIVFMLPIFSGDDTDTLSQTVIAIIFILGPMGSLVSSMQNAATAQFSLKSINEFEDTLKQLVGEWAPHTGACDFGEFESLKLKAVQYQHGEEDGFAISDINLTLERGEIVFLTGGNGSGKTTLLRVMCGLYPRAGGSIKLNGQETPLATTQAFRELFSSVFSDFYLFDGLYGVSESDLPTLENWLVKLDIRDKIQLDFSDVHGEHLSTGQRKRLALALALTEKRPILVLDEWAADQDPETRRWFYETLIPQLKSDGVTCFVITHDESYFNCCDRRLHMIEGYLEEE